MKIANFDKVQQLNIELSRLKRARLALTEGQKQFRVNLGGDILSPVYIVIRAEDTQFRTMLSTLIASVGEDIAAIRSQLKELGVDDE